MSLNSFTDLSEKPWMQIGPKDLTVYGDMKIATGLVTSGTYTPGAGGVAAYAVGQSISVPAAFGLATYTRMGSIVRVSGALTLTTAAGQTGVLGVPVPASLEIKAGSVDVSGSMSFRGAAVATQLVIGTVLGNVGILVTADNLITLNMQTPTAVNMAVEAGVKLYWEFQYVTTAA
jgi:hypothetical protein